MKTCAASSPCPCGRRDGKSRELRYADCCGRYLETDLPAPDAESLMRSRYSAFCLERAPYLQATWHASTRPVGVEFDAGVKWLGLEVKAAAAQGDAGVVEFVARYRDSSGRAHRLHEISRFVQEAGQWLYVDGQFPAE